MEIWEVVALVGTLSFAAFVSIFVWLSENNETVRKWKQGHDKRMRQKHAIQDKEKAELLDAAIGLTVTAIETYNSEAVQEAQKAEAKKQQQTERNWDEVRRRRADPYYEPEQEPEPEEEEPDKPTFPPDNLRPEHMMILGSTGQGKTQYIQELILEDLKTDYPIVVIDSQQDMLEKLLHVVPPDQLMYLDGSTTLAISPFDIGATNDNTKINMAVSLYENMFAALGTELTAKQATVFRFISRLLIEVPGSSFMDMLNILRFGATNYSTYVNRLPELSRTFLNDQLMSKSYTQTRDQVAERLFTLLENEHFNHMFSAPENRVDVGKAIKQRKIILVNTAQDVLGIQGAALFGRFILLQLALEVLRRPATNDRVYFYVDEFQEYASDSKIMERIFEQGRKRGLCMVCAFHRLGQMSPDLIDLMRTNTAIKVMGALNASDAAVLARDTMINAQTLIQTPKLTFAAFAKPDIRAQLTVNPGALENMPQRTKREIQSIKAQQAQLYGYQPQNRRTDQQNRQEDPDAPQDFD
jgi:hypothetical protein